MSVNTTR
jgi:ribosomal RNA assembly protein